MENPAGYKWNQKKILVVEDDEASAFLLGEILRDTGARVDYTSDGEEAVEFVRKHPETDLILMDILLPEMDGFEATREIKAFADHVIVIAQTAYGYALDHRLAEQAGCDAFLTKPLNSALLLDKMNSYLY